ncbi:GtrA family protein [Candidatus Pseudothioglobus singularis]|nr:GtrA family protein [Candidatus Pseudothioglobus singularis]
MKFSKFIRFSIIGAFGLIVDIFIFYLVLALFDLSIYTSKLFSTFVAICFTWYGNRIITFSLQKSNKIYRELLNYIYAMIPGNVVNYLVFCLIVYSIGNDMKALLFAIFLGVLSGLIVNFNLANLFVFKK